MLTESIKILIEILLGDMFYFYYVNVHHRGKKQIY